MQPRIALVGGGVGACSVAYGLREHLRAAKATISLFEMGRGPGGRAATRGTRERPELSVNHGAPAFAAHTPEFTALCDGLAASAGGVIERVAPSSSKAMRFGVIKPDGSFEVEDAMKSPTRFAPLDGSGMGSFCDSLLRGGEPPSSPLLAETAFGSMVGSVEAVVRSKPTDSQRKGGSTQWALSSNKGEPLGTFDFLVVSSTAIAHPRWRTTFGGEPPLVEAAASLGDPHLDAALSALVPLSSKPVTACLLAFEAEAAAAWASLPFFKAAVEGDETLSRVVVQRINPSLTAVVLHSTHEFARSAAHVYGATSTAARLAGAATDDDAEARVLEKMLAAAEKRLGTLLGDAAHVRSAVWGPHLHRWGAAFPDAPLLPHSHAFIPSASVAFCGDFVDGDRAGSVEGAALSGLRTADALAMALGLGES
jgi:predicted NAD/FAD-dependent oxidoreductase